MTIKDLIEKLKEFDENDLVVLSIDEEGNGYYEPYCVNQMAYNRDWREVGYRNITPELEKLGYTEEDLCQSDSGTCVNCVVLS